MPQQANGATIKSIIENRPLKFHIRAGGAKWMGTIHSDRASYDRAKSQRTNSDVSTLSSTSSDSAKSA